MRLPRLHSFSTQIHTALATELAQVSREVGAGAAKVDQVERKVDGLEIKFDAMNNVLSTNLKTLCTLALSKEKNDRAAAEENENQEETPAALTAASAEANESQETTEKAAADGEYKAMVDMVASRVSALESKVSSLDSEAAKPASDKETEEEEEDRSKIELGEMKTRVDEIAQATDKLAASSAKSEDLLQMAQTVSSLAEISQNFPRPKVRSQLTPKAFHSLCGR